MRRGSGLSLRSCSTPKCPGDHNRPHFEQAFHMTIDVGARLKHVREVHGLSQRELARRAGVTNGLISLIEQNRVSPSVGSLKKVLDGVPLSMAEFFTLDVNSATQVFYAADELVEIGGEGASLRL